MLQEIEGIIVKEILYSETSKVIHIYTKQGIISVMCKGAKKIKSPFRATTLKFTYAKFKIIYKKDKLSILVSVDVIDSLKNILSDIVLLSYVNYLTELTIQVVKQTEVNLYYDFIAVIQKINIGLDPKVLCNILEIKYLDYLGVKLTLDACAGCGSKNDILTIDGDKGGYVCSKCYQNELIVDKKTIELLRKYYYVDIKNIKKLSVSAKVSGEIDQFIDRYYERYTGLYLQSKQFLKKLL